MKGNPYKVMVDIRACTSIDREAREAYAVNPLNLAVALLIGNPISRMLGNFYLGLNRVASPIRLFNSEDKAISWLNAQGSSDNE